MNDRDKMTERDTERILVETLKISRENRDMLEKISNRQTQSRVFSVLKWIVGLAILGIVVYFGYPHFKEIQAQISAVTSQVSGLTDFAK